MNSRFVPAVAPPPAKRITETDRQWAHGYDACCNGRPWSAMFTDAMRRGWMQAERDGQRCNFRDEYSRIVR